MLHEREKLQLFSMKVGKGTSSCILKTAVERASTVGRCGRGWRVVHNKQEKQAAVLAILRQALQAMSPTSTQQTTQSLEVRFMPS